MSVFIIAEAGVNHNGNLDMAKQLIEQAALAKADAIKFQTFQADKLVSAQAPKAEYQKTTTGTDQTQREMIKQLELSKDDHLVLLDHCAKHNIMFLSSAFDDESLDLLEELNLPMHKVPSGELTNIPFLRRISLTKKPVILSTGMSEMEEIEQAVATLKKYGTTDLTILHCNTEYPTPLHDVNLRAMDLLQEVFQCKIGYSDHTLGIAIPLAAVARGAQVIEKHITLDRRLPGPDHQASIEIPQLHQMVDMIRQIEVALGEKHKVVTASESKNRAIARKSLFTKTVIRAGEMFTFDNLTSKRPGTGIDVRYFDDLIGKKANHDYEADTMLQLDERR